MFHDDRYLGGVDHSPPSLGRRFLKVGPGALRLGLKPLRTFTTRIQTFSYNARGYGFVFRRGQSPGSSSRRFRSCSKFGVFAGRTFGTYLFKLWTNRGKAEF